MRHLYLWLIVCLPVFLQTSCLNISKNQGEMQHRNDSVLKATADSIARTDPWIRYTYEERDGKRLFEIYCIVCHGKGGEGDGFNAYNLNPRPHSLADTTYMKALSPAILEEIISYGGKSMNKSLLMPAYVYTLNKNQISDLTAYIETFTKN